MRAAKGEGRDSRARAMGRVERGGYTLTGDEFRKIAEDISVQVRGEGTMFDREGAVW